MEHSFESHTRCVNDLCRICGRLCVITPKQKKNNNRVHKCVNLATDILLIYGFDINQEHEDTYSKFICVKCFSKKKDIKRLNSSNILARAKEMYNINKDIWCSYKAISKENCTVCSHRDSLSVGCCMKRKTSHRTTETAVSPQPGHSHDDHNNQPCTSTSLEHEGPNSLTQIPYIETVQSHTTHTDSTDINCITDTFLILSDETSTSNMLADQTVDATLTSFTSNTDPSTSTNETPLVPLAGSTPIKPIQTKDSSTSPMMKNEITFSQSLSLSQDTPLSKHEEQLTTHLVRRKLNADPKKQTILCKTSGQPMSLQRVTIPRKNTQLVRTPTKRKRAKLLQSLRTSVAGGSCSSTDTQLASELKRIPVDRRQDITKKASVRQQIKISRLHALAIKEKMGLSWRQGRKHGSLLRKVGIQVENEKSVRKLSREMVSNFVKVENRLFVKEDTVENEVPYGRIGDLPKFVDSLLDSYDTQNLLTWQGGSIPQDEIWVKIGGDHGKNSLKFTLQIANLEKPNARHNTVVIAIASVRDTHDNMVRFLEGGLASDLKALQSHSWRNKSLKVFLNGDYEFLCKMYGLSGPQGTYPCLWCLMPRRDMHEPSGQCQQRSLESLLADNSAFVADSSGKKEVAKFHNALHTPLLNIDLDSVAPPYLHILLGVVLKHHKLLEDAAHNLDQQIATQHDKYLTPLGQSLKKYGSQWRQKQDLENKLQHEEGCLAFSEIETDSNIVNKHAHNIQDIEQRLSSVSYKTLTPRTGPVASSLDTVLNKHKITPQAYHSRSFVGNHCHKYLQPNVYTDLTETIIKQTQTLTNNPFLIDEAYTIQITFNDLNSAFRTVHKFVSHTAPIDDSSLPDIQTAIDNYMTIYRRMFHNKVIPKQHLLEHHCIPHIRKHKFGLGLLGEQGTENSHRLIAHLEKHRAHGFTNELDKLHHILTAHLLQIAPSLRA